VIVEERARDAPAVAASPEPVAARRGWSPLAAVLALLPLAALTELFLVRTFYRVGVYIPKEGPFRTVYGALTAVGSFALNLSSVLVAVALALLAVDAYRRGLRRAAAALGSFVAVSLVLAAAGTANLGPMARLAFVLAVAVVAWPFVRSQAGGWHRVAVAGVAASALLASYAGFVADAGRLVPSAGPGGAVGSQLAAEALVIATAVFQAVEFVGLTHFRLHVVRDGFVQGGFEVGERVVDRVRLAFGKERRAVELHHLLFHHAAYKIGRIHLMDAIAEPAVETVRIEQRQEELEVFLLAVVRRGG